MKDLLGVIILVTSVLAVSGCEILSLSSYPEKSRELNPVIPIGKFVTLENDPLTISRVGENIGIFMHSNDVEEGTDPFLMYVYKLENFRGFSLEPVPIETEVIESVRKLNPNLPLEVETEILSAGVLSRFGIIEVYDEALLLMIPHQPAFEQIVREMGINSFRVDLESMYTSTALAASPEELVALMDRALPTNMFVPMVLAPAGLAEDWNLDTEMDEMRAQVRARYPKLIDRLEEIERATEQ